MGPFTIFAVTILLLAALFGLFCFSAVKAGNYYLPFATLLGLPVAVFLVEAFAFPSSLDGVTTLTGIFTMMFCVIWVPYWIIMAVLGLWRAPKVSE